MRSSCSDSIVYVAVGLLLATAALAAMFGGAPGGWIGPDACLAQ
jgi:hypothetical protein